MRIDQLAHKLGRNTGARIGIRILQLPVRLIVGVITQAIPRRQDLYVFGAPLGRFGDNAAYLFLWLAEQNSHEIVWVTTSRTLQRRLREAGYRCELRWSISGVLACMRAGTFVYNAYVSDINRWLWRGATTVNLWHGVPFKKIERDIAGGPLAFMYHPKNFRRLVAATFADELHTPDVMLAPSDKVARECFATAFSCPMVNFLVAGYPRNDHFCSGDRPPIVDLVPSKGRWESLREEFVVGYFPTWRDDNRTFLGGSGQLSVEVLADAVGKIGGTLLYKPHYNTDGVPIAASTESLVLLDADDDVHAFLPLCDVLITDYSSLAFDFMLLERPIIYYVPDLEEYVSMRGSYFEPTECMPGTMATTPSELLSAVASARDISVDARLPAISRWLWEGNTVSSASKIIRALVLSAR